MSAFVVDPKTINRILTYLRRRQNDGSWFSSRVQHYLKPTEFNIDDHMYVEDLGQAMYDLNVNAVSQRYPGSTINNLPGSVSENGALLPFSYESSPCSIMQVYKSLGCLLYQCAEGNAVETAMYKALSEIKSLIATEIVKSLPEYGEADWS